MEMILKTREELRLLHIMQLAYNALVEIEKRPGCYENHIRARTAKDILLAEMKKPVL